MRDCACVHTALRSAVLCGRAGEKHACMQAVPMPGPCVSYSLVHACNIARNAPHWLFLMEMQFAAQELRGCCVSYVELRHGERKQPWQVGGHQTRATQLGNVLCRQDFVVRALAGSHCTQTGAKRCGSSMCMATGTLVRWPHAWLRRQSTTPRLITEVRTINRTAHKHRMQR